MSIGALKKWAVEANPAQSTALEMGLCLSRYARALAVFVFAFIAMAVLPAVASASPKYTLTTGLRSGVFFPVGVGLATLMKLKQDEPNNVLLEIRGSSGSEDNIHALLRGEADIAFVDAATAIAALTRTPPFDVYENATTIRALAPLWQDVGHFVIKNDFVIAGGVSDFRRLSGEAISMGTHTSASYAASAHMLEQLGLSYSQLFTVPDLQNIETLRSFERDLISGFMMFTGSGDRELKSALERPGSDATMLSVSDESLSIINTTEIPVWEPYVIPAGTYAGQDEDLQTISQRNFLVVREDFNVNAATYLVRTLYTNPKFLGALHVAARSIGRENPLEQSIIPLHDGAVAYFEEAFKCDSILCLFN